MSTQIVSTNKAKTLLVHYFRLAGVVDDYDNVVEIEEVVDHILEAVDAKINEQVGNLLKSQKRE